MRNDTIWNEMDQCDSDFARTFVAVNQRLSILSPIISRARRRGSMPKSPKRVGIILKPILQMKRFQQLFGVAMLLLVISLFTACRKENIQTTQESTIHNGATPVTDHYLAVIQEFQSKGHKVHFDDGNGKWVDNPDRAWLQTHFNEAGAVGYRSGDNSFVFEVYPYVELSFANAWLYNGTAPESFVIYITPPQLYPWDLYVSSTYTNKADVCYQVGIRGRERQYAPESGDFDWTVRRWDGATELTPLSGTQASQAYSNGNYTTVESAWCN